MDATTDFSLSPIETDPALVAFQFPFKLEGKADDNSIVEELDDGDLIIDGMAVSFDGTDRQSENFAAGCLSEGLKAFVDSGAALCYHHKHDKILGSVLAMEEVPGGIKVRARVDGAIKAHPELGTLYSQIKNGTLKSFSLGGFFKRKMTPDGVKITHVDPTELSITGVPVLAKGTQFSVVAGKALEGFDEPTPAVPFESLNAALDLLSGALEGKAEVPEPKGDPDDLHALALILAFEQITNDIPEAADTPDKDNDAAVDKLIEEVKTAVDGFAKQAHKLAAKLGPLPQVSWMHEVHN